MAQRVKGRAIGLRGFHLVHGERVWENKMPGALRDWQIKCVCGGGAASCNNGWMRDKIENPAQNVMERLFKGDPVRLSAHDQQRIAAWAVLKAIVAEYDNGDFRTTHHMQRKYIMRHHLPPKRNWGVWIGFYERKDWKAEWISSALFVAPDHWPDAKLNQRPTRFNGHSVTQVINKLLVQVVSLPKADLVKRWRFAMPDGGQLFRIWPPSQYSIKWPGNGMTDREADLVSSALAQTGRRIVQRRLARAQGNNRSGGSP
jgi:hypothetical protein